MPWFLFVLFIQTLRNQHTPAMLLSAVIWCCLSFLFSEKHTKSAHPFYKYSVNLNRMEIKGEYSNEKAISTWTERAKDEEKRLIDKKLFHRLFLLVPKTTSLPSSQHRESDLITKRHPHQNHVIWLWFGLGGIPVLHQSYQIVCEMKSCCTVQLYRKTINFIFLLVMQFQNIPFSQDTAVSSSEILELWFSPSLWQCCAFPEMVTIICHQKALFK